MCSNGLCVLGMKLASDRYFSDWYFRSQTARTGIVLDCGDVSHTQFLSADLGTWITKQARWFFSGCWTLRIDDVVTLLIIESECGLHEGYALPHAILRMLLLWTVFPIFLGSTTVPVSSTPSFWSRTTSFAVDKIHWWFPLTFSWWLDHLSQQRVLSFAGDRLRSGRFRDLPDISLIMTRF